jgi:predicted DCC family thiol-disulfide oxidoreductase YuxK
MRTQPVLVYDGECGFCTTSVAFTQRRIRPLCGVRPWRFADLDALETTRERAAYELLWISPRGTVHGRAQAVAKLLLSARGGWAVLGGMLRVPPIRWTAHAVYRLVANNRDRMPGGTPGCVLPADRRPTTPQG